MSRIPIPTLVGTAVVLTAGLTIAGTSAAQQAAEVGEQAYGNRMMAAPTRAYELTLDTGYTQGFGNVAKGNSLRDEADAGMSFDLGLGYRLSPELLVGVSGGYQVYNAGNDVGSSPTGVTGKIDAAWHFAPYERLDPWLQAGVGYRYLNAGARDLHGLQLLNVDVGVDVRLDRQFALTPLIGASLDMFLWDGGDAITDPRLNTFVFGGIRARFDLGGTYSPPPATIASR